MLDLLVSQFQASSILELTAVIFAIAYLLLAVKENILCWYAAFISTAIFLLIFWQVKLYMESGLQVYYLAMAVYGWYQWTRGGTQQSGITISTWPIEKHLLALATVLIATMVSGYLLSENTDARLPYLDSFTTWASIVTTYMVAKKVLENWIYWFVIDSVSIFLYLHRELYFTALLFAAYIIIVVFGFATWFKQYRLEPVNP
ncbi:MAG TPA: nicotinamide mononucleotide transporter [Gammaproteobacteria bacterium]|nr:nicotinamide mononucleotide transporter [Gammaproteobacteria bacterium]